MPDFPVWMYFFSLTLSDSLSIDFCPNLWPLDPGAQLWNSLLPDEKEGWGAKKQWVSLFYQLQCFPGYVVREVQSFGKIQAEDLAPASRISFLRWAVALLSKVRISHCFMWLYWRFFFHVTHLIQGACAQSFLKESAIIFWNVLLWSIAESRHLAKFKGRLDICMDHNTSLDPLGIMLTGFGADLSSAFSLSCSLCLEFRV